MTAPKSETIPHPIAIGYRMGGMRDTIIAFYPDRHHQMHTCAKHRTPEEGGEEIMREWARNIAWIHGAKYLGKLPRGDVPKDILEQVYGEGT